MNKVRVVPMFAKVQPKPGQMVINACSNSRGDWPSGLSPFLLGPCPLYASPKVPLCSKTMENAWQYAKLYPSHADTEGQPTVDYWEWACGGWNNSKAVRYPMGKGAVPLCSLWEGKCLGYVDARKKIYGPLYRDAVKNTPAYRTLQNFLLDGVELVIRDFDGYDHLAKNMSLSEVLNFPNRKMGHAFVLAMMLENDQALGEFK